MFLFLMLTYFCANTASRLLVRVFSQHTNLSPYKASFVLTLPTYLCMLLYSLFTYSDIFHGVGLLTIALMLLHAVGLTYFGKVSIQAQRHVDTASFMILRQVVVPVSVILSTLLIGESLSWIQCLGMICILLGTYIISSEGRLVSVRHVGKYELAIIAYGVFLGGSIVFARYIQELTSLATLLVVGSGLETMVAGVAAYAKEEHKTKISKRDVITVSVIGVLSAVHIITFFDASDVVDNIAVVSTISSFRIVTIFFASYLFLGEKSHFRLKLAGSALALLGVLLV